MIEVGEKATLNKHLFKAAFVNKTLDEHLFECVLTLLALRELLLQGFFLELDFEHGSVSSIAHLSSSCEVFANKLSSLLVDALTKGVLRLELLLNCVLALLTRLIGLDARAELKLLLLRVIDCNRRAFGLLKLVLGRLHFC